jgi:hypothetical protein
MSEDKKTESVSHTPGPWEAYRDDRRERYEIGHRRVVLGTRVVASVQFGFDELRDSEQHANARLISAAPALLKLAREYASGCITCSGSAEIIRNKSSDGDPLHDFAEPCPECEHILHVIAKAEGRA